MSKMFVCMYVLFSLITPCEGCVAPYGFHNQMPLTDDTAQFQVSFSLQSKKLSFIDLPFRLGNTL